MQSIFSVNGLALEIVIANNQATLLTFDIVALHFPDIIFETITASACKINA